MKIPIPIIIDFIIVLILIISMLIGRKRGLIKTFSGILTVIIAFSLASFAAKETAPIISEKYIAPYLTSLVNIETDNSLETSKELFDFSDLSKPFSKIGIPEGIIEDAVSDVTKTLSQSVIEPLTAMTNNISYRITYGILFVAYFLISLLIVFLLFKLLNQIAKLPVINFANRLLGLIFGLISGYLIIIISYSVLNKCGILLTDAVISETVILKHITNFSIISFFN